MGRYGSKQPNSVNGAADADDRSWPIAVTLPPQLG